jgi:hypothetical protein
MYTNYSIYTKNKYTNEMATFTISISEDLKKKMEEHSDINWTDYLKKRFEQRIKEFRKFEELKNRGEL